MQTANLFTDGAGRVLTMINGSMDTSSGTALLLLTLYKIFGYTTCWIIYGSLSLLIIFRTLFQLPKTTIPQVKTILRAVLNNTAEKASWKNLKFLSKISPCVVS